MAKHTKNYSADKNTLENNNADDKYDVTGESEFTRESTIPYDQDEVLSERHYNFTNPIGRVRVRSREHQDESTDFGTNKEAVSERTDSTIQQSVREALYRNGVADASDIDVTVSEGEVTLKGFVKDWDQKMLAENSLEHIPGVTEINNDLAVVSDRPPSSGEGLIQNRTGMN